MANWTDEQKQEIKDEYLAAEPTAANSTEIVAEMAEARSVSPNAIRMLLSNAKVYVTKEKAPAKATAAGGGDKPARVSKEGAQAALTSAIEEAGGEADAEIISKLTGKAAQYFTAVIAKITANED